MLPGRSNCRAGLGDGLGFEYWELANFGVDTGCGRFFEGTPEQMHVALNKTLAGLPADTKVYVCIPSSLSPSSRLPLRVCIFSLIFAPEDPLDISSSETDVG